MESFLNFFQRQDIQRNRERAASVFLTEGVVLGTFGGSKCYDSGDCASGWYCKDNQCINPTQTKTEDGCGGPAGAGGCGGTGGCNTSTPGTDCGVAADCCGTRCCRYQSGGQYTGLVVNCYCGECPKEEGTCTSFCDSYYKNNGRSAEGCSGDAQCSECSYCNSQGNCVIQNGGPCWCDVTRTCELCQDNGSWTADPACWPCRNFTKCGEPTGERYCSPGLNGSLALLQSVNGRLIDEPCDAGCQSPECDTVSIDLPGGPPANGLNTPISSIYPGCCAGCECKLNGYISAEGTGMTTYLIEECDIGSLPAECCKVECNCHSECPSGSKCSNGGRCI